MNEIKNQHTNCCIVVLTQATLKALAEVRQMTMAEAVRVVDQGTCETRFYLFILLKAFYLKCLTHMQNIHCTITGTINRGLSFLTDDSVHHCVLFLVGRSFASRDNVS